MWIDQAGALYLMAGFLGALVANCTGAGGGVIFIPLFSLLGLPGPVAISTSLHIQSLGMTTGAFSWFFKQRESRWVHVRMALFCALFALAGAYLAKTFFVLDDSYTLLFFGIMSVGVGVFSLVIKPRDSVPPLLPWHYFLLACLSVAGGVITMNLSIGIGELVYIALIYIGWPVRRAIATAVMATAMTVLGSLLWIRVETSPVASMVLMIGLGAIGGGSIASLVVRRFGDRKVKRGCAAIIILTGCMELIKWQVAL